jgi:methylisocitrate lyase
MQTPDMEVSGRILNAHLYPDSDEADPIMITRTIQQYARSGVAALHIEDQVQMQRCGHLQGKQLVSTSEFLIRIRAAVAARHAVNSDLVIIARTDALQSLGYNDSIARLQLAREAGADVGFLEGITSEEEARAVVQDLAPWPVLLNMVVGVSEISQRFPHCWFTLVLNSEWI